MPLSYRDAEREIFDPANDPILGVGYLSDTYRATPEQLDLATRKLAERRRRWPWARLPAHATEAERLRRALQARRREGVSLRQAMKSPEFDPDQRPVRRRELARQRALRRRVLRDLDAGRIWFRALPWYDLGILLHCEGQDALRLAVVSASPRLAELTGASGPIHAMNDEVPIRLTSETVEEYLAFFCEHVHGDHGGFHLIEEEFVDRSRPDDPDRFLLSASDLREGPGLAGRRGTAERGRAGRRPYPRAVIPCPVTVLSVAETGWTTLATVVYGGEVFRAVFEVHSTGLIDMIADRGVDGVALQGPVLRWRPTKGDG